MNTKNILIAFAFLFCCEQLSAQINWKDSVKVKKVIDAYEYESRIYFKTKKGWGVWDREKKAVAIQPQYQFVVYNSFSNDGYFFVANQKIGCLNNNGAVTEQPVWSRRGFLEYSYSSTNYVIYNSEVYSKSDSAFSYESEYRQLTNANEFSITINGNYIILNNAKGYDNYLPIYSTNGDDSVDVNGNVVFMDPVIAASSKVFDWQKGAWVNISAFKSEKFGYCGSSVLGIYTVGKSNHLVIYKDDFARTTRLILDSLTPMEIAKEVLVSYQPANMTLISDDFSGNYVTFNSNGKYGLLFMHGYTVLVEPGFDFLYLPKAFYYYWFGVKDGKVGMLKIPRSKSLIGTDYNEIQIKSVLTDNEISNKHITCNGFDPDLYQHDERVLVDSTPTRKWDFTQPIASVKVLNDNAVVNDFYPMGPDQTTPIMVFDQYGEPRDSISGYDSRGNPNYVYPARDPGYSRGGVFNMATKKWMIPQRYSNILATAEGYACMRYFADSLTFSYYKKNGDVVFLNKTVEELKKNSNWVAQLVGDNSGGNPKVIWMDKRMEYGIFMGWPVVYSNNGKTGLFDLIRFEWIYPMQYEYIDYCHVNDSYLIFANGKQGLGTPYGEVLIPASFKRIQYCYSSEGYVCDDSVFYSFSSGTKMALLDTVKLDCRERAESYANEMYRFKSVLEKNKVNISEYHKWDVFQVNPETGEMEENFKTLDTANSRIVDVKSLQTQKIPNASTITPWKNGLLYQQHNDKWFFTTDGKQITELGSRIAVEKDFIAIIEGSTSFRVDPDGSIYEVQLSDDLFEIEGVRTIEMKKWFDGTAFIKPEKGFYAYAINKNKMAFGVKIEMDKQLRVSKKYMYYNFSTKEYTPCELPLDPVKFLEVMPLQEYFLVVETDYMYEKDRVWFLENDLRTVKSEFLKLQDVKYEFGFTHEYDKPIVFSLVELDGQVMLFDKDFQFLIQSLTPDVEYTSPRWNRLKIKTRAKTMLMNANGNIIK